MPHSGLLESGNSAITPVGIAAMSGTEHFQVRCCGEHTSARSVVPGMPCKCGTRLGFGVMGCGISHHISNSERCFVVKISLKPLCQLIDSNRDAETSARIATSTAPRTIHGVGMVRMARSAAVWSQNRPIVVSIRFVRSSNSRTFSVSARSRGSVTPSAFSIP